LAINARETNFQYGNSSFDNSAHFARLGIAMPIKKSVEHRMTDDTYPVCEDLPALWEYSLTQQQD
jgi:hypothetical protein